MKLFFLCVVIKVVVTVGHASELELNHTNREGNGIKRFARIQHSNTNLNHSGDSARYAYESNKFGHNVKESNFEKLFKLNGNSKNSTSRVKYIKIVRYVPVRVEITGRNAKDQNVNAEASLDVNDYNSSINDKFEEINKQQNDKVLRTKSTDTLATLLAKYFISKYGKDSQKLVQHEKENYKLDIKEFIQYLQSLGIEQSEISKYEELLQRNAIGFQETLNQQHNSLTEKQNEYQKVIPLNYDLTGVKEIGILNDVNSDAIGVKEVQTNIQVGDKGSEQDISKVKFNDDLNLELNNIGKTQVMEVPINGNIITKQQQPNPKLLFDVTEDQVMLPNNSNTELQQQNLEVIDVKENQPSNLLKEKDLNGTTGITEPKSQLVDNKETLFQKEYKLSDLDTNGNVTEDIDFYDYQEKMEIDAVNKHNKSLNDKLMNTTDKYENVSLEVGINLPNKGPESIEIIKLPYTTLKDGLVDTETNNPLKDLYNQYVKTGNINFDNYPSEKPNLTSIFDVQFSGLDLVPDNVEKNAEIKTETSSSIKNSKKDNVKGEVTQLRNILSEILITLKQIFGELSSFEKQPKLMEMITGKINDNDMTLVGLQNLVNIVRILQDKLDFENVFTKLHLEGRLITKEDKINEVLTNAVKAFLYNGVSNHEVKRVVQQSLLNVITRITTNRVKECQEKVWSEVKHDLQLALYRNMLAFTVNSEIDTQVL